MKHISSCQFYNLHFTRIVMQISLLCVTNFCRFSCHRWVCILCYSRMWMTRVKRYRSAHNHASLQHKDQWLQSKHTPVEHHWNDNCVILLCCVICKATHVCRSCRPRWACIQADRDSGRSQASSHRCAHSRDLIPDTSPSLQIQRIYEYRESKKF